MSRHVRWPLLPLVPVYAAAQALDALSHAHRWRRREQLCWPVVSVGNLSFGGAGKTPFVISLARSMVARGWRVDVLSRGYGRASHAAERVVEGTQDPAARFGDEPWLIAQTAQVPVFVGRERIAAGRLAERSLGDEQARHVHLLDDGMQHRQLKRDVEIVLLHRTDFETTLLPAGRLREPMAALERADVVVLRQEDHVLAERVRRWMRSSAEIWHIIRALEVPTLPGPAVIFSAIAHPDEFAAGVRKRGVTVAAEHAWRDHHRFHDADLRVLIQSAKRSHVACFVTTEKDMVRLTNAQRMQLERVGPVLAARLTVTLMDEASVISALEERLLTVNSGRGAL